MISVCTVILGSDCRFFDIWLESLVEKSEIVSELLMVDVNPTVPASEIAKKIPATWKINWKILSLECKPSMGHPWGLRKCFEQATQTYVLTSDPDVFYYKKGFDRFMVEVHEENKLLVSGIQHYCWQRQAYGSFPSVNQLLIKREDLPPDDFMQGEMDLPPSAHPQAADHWLTRGVFPKDRSHFPLPKQIYDTGAFLNEYVHRKGGRWLSYITFPGQSIFLTKNTNNFGLRKHYGNLPLLYHQGLAMRPGCTEKVLGQFTAAWNRSRYESKRCDTLP